MGETLHHAIHGPQSKGQFLPGYDYLLIDLQGRQAVMALGARQTTATPQGDVTDEYWYSGNKEMLHLRDGRIQKLLGATTEWRDSRGQPPSWASLQAGQPATPWRRERDEMPHYRYGLEDRISTQAISEPPPDKRPAAAQTNAPLRWVQDTVQSVTPQGQRWTFEQYFALQHNRVVYSEQCISPQLCVRLSYKPSTAPLTP